VRGSTRAQGGVALGALAQFVQLGFAFASAVTLSVGELGLSGMVRTTHEVPQRVLGMAPTSPLEVQVIAVGESALAHLPEARAALEGLADPVGD